RHIVRDVDLTQDIREVSGQKIILIAATLLGAVVMSRETVTHVVTKPRRITNRYHRNIVLRQLFPGAHEPTEHRLFTAPRRRPNREQRINVEFRNHLQSRSIPPITTLILLRISLRTTLSR